MPILHAACALPPHGTQFILPHLLWSILLIPRRPPSPPPRPPPRPPPPADNILQRVVIQGSNGTADAASTFCRCGWVTGFLVGSVASGGGSTAIATMGVRCRCGRQPCGEGGDA